MLLPYRTIRMLVVLPFVAEHKTASLLRPGLLAGKRRARPVSSASAPPFAKADWGEFRSKTISSVHVGDCRVATDCCQLNSVCVIANLTSRAKELREIVNKVRDSTNSVAAPGS